MNRRPRRLFLLIASSLHAALAIAQSEPAAPDPDVLRGPSVVAAPAANSTKPTLVRRDFQGKLERIDLRPEFAATEVMALDEATKAKLAALRTQRTAEIDAGLKANLPLFLEIQGANQAGDRAGAQPLIRKLRQAAPDLFEPLLADRCAKEMSQADAGVFRAIVNEYMQAVVQETAASRGPPSDPGPAPLDSRRTENMLTIRELAQALGSTVAERRERLDAALLAIDASPELGDKIRGIIRATAAKSTAGDLSPEQRAASTRQILELLTPEQRRIWLDRGRAGR